MEGLESMNFVSPTPIQEQAMPVILQRKDLIACAQTGTGKTAAFLLPLLHILKTTPPKREGAIRALIIGPTRELALQIDRELEGFSYFTDLSSITVYGGNDSALWEQQKKAFIHGADIVIGTPGRLMSHMNFEYVNLDSLEILILDEADRMLEMGFIDDIMKIVERIPKERQTLMFSATMPGRIRHLAKTIQHNPEQIDIAVSKPNENVLQVAYLAEEREKITIIESLLKGQHLDNAIIFTSTRRNARKLEQTLENLGLNVKAIHSDLDQKDREEALRMFKYGRIQILVATDILSRGIDINGLSMVCNFDVPASPEDYIHRIGRTARADNTGVAITLISKADARKFIRIEKFLGHTVYKMPEVYYRDERAAAQADEESESSKPHSRKPNSFRKEK